MGANDTIDRRRSEAEARREGWRWQRRRGFVCIPQKPTTHSPWPLAFPCAAPLLPQRLTYGLPALCCPFHLSCAVHCASHRCLPLTLSNAPRQVYRTTSSNLMLRHILTVITLGTAHGFGPLLSVEATDMNTC